MQVNVTGLAVALLAGLTFFVIVTTPACSDDPASEKTPGDDDAGADSGADSRSLSTSGFPVGTAYVTAVCDRTERCISTIAYKDRADCIAVRQADFDRKRRAPDDGATQAAVDACAARFTAPTLTCDDHTDFEECKFRGKRAPGAACASDSQCNTSLCEKKTSTDDCGVCVEYAAKDASCALRYCAGGLFCNALKQCASSVPAGGDCVERYSCASGFRCAGGKCRTPVPIGGTCTPTGSECAGDLGCVNGMCARQTLKSAAVGESCDPTGADPVFCRGSRCDTTTKRCVELPKLGAACSTKQPTVYCDQAYECVNEKCRVPEIGMCN